MYNNNSNRAVMIGSSNGTNSYVKKMNADFSAATYGIGNVATLSGKANLIDMYLTGSINSNSVTPILVSGTSAGAMWGATISTDGTSITYVGSGSGLTTGNVIRQTTNGRILIAGYNGSSGAIAAFGSVTSGGVYPLDTSFGNAGIYTTGINTEIYAMTVDSYNRIYLAYKNGFAITVQRLLANGTTVDSSFSATFTPAVSSYSASQICLALDMTNSQLVVAVQDGTLGGNILQVKRFNIANGSAAGSTSSVTIASKVLNLSNLFIDALQNMYVVGYNSTDNKAVVARIASTSTSTIALDTSNYAVSGGSAGIANVSAGSMTVVNAGAYNPDRRTYFVGVDGFSNGYIGRFYGDVYTAQVSASIGTAAIGSIDTSLQPNNSGQIDLSSQTDWSGLVSGYKARAVFVNSNNDGTAFIAFGNGTNLILGKVNADMRPITSFGDSGSSNGLTAAIAMSTVNNITVDASNNIVVTGANEGVAKTVLYNSSGVYQATFATTVTSTNGSTVVQQKSGRYIVGGYNGSDGLIIAYKNESAISASSLPVDLTFGPSGSNGYYETGVNAPIDDLCIDDNDNIYFTYRNASNVVCFGKLTANGSGLVNSQNSPATFNTGAIITTNIAGVTGGNPSRIAINSAGNILVGNTNASGAPTVQTALYDGSSGAQIGSTVSVYNASSPVLTKLVAAGT